MELNTIELRILTLLSESEIRGTATLGDQAIPAERNGRTAQGAALAVGRFVRSLCDKGLITGHAVEGDKLSTYRITPAGAAALESSRSSLAAAGLHEPSTR